MPMRSLVLGLATASLLVSSALAGQEDCGASSAERSAFVGSRMIAALDTGRDQSGALPGWAEAFIKDPEAHGDALARYCDLYPSASLDAALNRVFAEKRTASTR